MGYQEIQNSIKELDSEKKKLQKKLSFEPKILTKEEMFVELIQDLTIKWDDEQCYITEDAVLYFKGDELFFIITDKYVACASCHVWCIFEEKYRMNDFEIQKFISDMMKKYFKYDNRTALMVSASTYVQIEHRFKIKKPVKKSIFYSIQKFIKEITRFRFKNR